MVNKSGRIGTAAESGVVKYLVANGFPFAERRRLKGGRDEGDLITVPGLCVEVKGGERARNASVRQIAEWMIETEVERGHARADVGMLVVQRRGVAPARAGLWRAVFPAWAWAQLLGAPAGACAALDVPVEVSLAHAVAQLRVAGYGQPLDRPGSAVAEVVELVSAVGQ